MILWLPRISMVQKSLFFRTVNEYLGMYLNQIWQNNMSTELFSRILWFWKNPHLNAQDFEKFTTMWKCRNWFEEKSALNFLNLISFVYHSEFYKFLTVHFCSLIIINHSLRLSSQSLDFLNKKNDKITPLLFCAFSNRWSINFSSNFPIFVKQIEILAYQRFFINAI